MPSPLRIGIVGTGFGARVHLPAFHSLPGAVVVALGDSGSGRAAQLAPDGVAGMEWQTLVSSTDIDAVVVALPPIAHRAVVEAALASGKSVLCEKPFGVNAQEAEAMTAAAAAKAGVIGAVGFQFRYEPHLMALRDAIGRGEAGAVQSIELAWLYGARASTEFPWSWQNDAGAGGGILNVLASHVLDLFAWLTGSPVATVERSETAILIPRRPDARGIQQDVTAEDWSKARLRLASGVAAGFEVSNCVPEGQGMEIIVSGAEGRLSCGQRPPFRPADAFLRLERANGTVLSLPIPPRAGYGGADTRLLAVQALGRDFLAAVAGHPSSVPRFGDGLAMREILDRIQWSKAVREVT